MVKKGKDTRNKITEYEIERTQRIKQNQERINALRLKHLSTFLPKWASVGRKRVSVQVDDNDYVPAIGDDELSSSLNNKVLYIWFGACDTSYFIIFFNEFKNLYIFWYDTDGTKT